MSITGLSTAYRNVDTISNGHSYWKPCCWLINGEKNYLVKYKEFSGEGLRSTRATINYIREMYNLRKILLHNSFFIVGLKSIFDENFNLLLHYDNRNVWIKYGAMISSAKEKAIVKYLNIYLALKIIYVESFDEIYYNPTIKFKTRQEILEIEEELTGICKKLLN